MGAKSKKRLEKLRHRPMPWDDYAYEKDAYIGRSIVWLERGRKHVSGLHDEVTSMAQGLVIDVQLVPPPCGNPRLWPFYKHCRLVTVMSDELEQFFVTADSLDMAVSDFERLATGEAGFIEQFHADERVGAFVVERGDDGFAEKMKINLRDEPIEDSAGDDWDE